MGRARTLATAVCAASAGLLLAAASSFADSAPATNGAQPADPAKPAAGETAKPADGAAAAPADPAKDVYKPPAVETTPAGVTIYRGSGAPQ